MEILNFHKDSKGRIWLYTLNGKVGFIQDGRIHNSSNTKFLEGIDFDSRITSVQERDGVFFISGHLSGGKIFTEKGKIHRLEREGYYHHIQVLKENWFWFNSKSKESHIYYGLIADIGKDSLAYFEVKGNVDSTGIVTSPLKYMISNGDQIVGATDSKVNQYIFSLNMTNYNFQFLHVNDFEIYNIKLVGIEICLLTSHGVKKLNEITLEVQKLFSIR